MSSFVNKSLGANLISGKSVIDLGIGWGVAALLFFLLFSVSIPGQDSTFWYLLGTHVLELVPFLLLAFWGRRFSQSWRIIATALFSLYIAEYGL